MNSHDLIATVLRTHGGVVSRRDCARIGLLDSGVRGLVADGRLVRVRRDAFVDAYLWRTAQPWERHGLRARAVIRALSPHGGHALSHHSALAVQGVTLYGVDARAHVVGLHGQRERRADILCVHTPVSPEERERKVRLQDGVPVVRPALACVQLAAYHGLEAGLVSADDGLRQGLFRQDELSRLADSYRGFRGRRQVREVARWATGLHESAGETRCSLALRLIGAAEPERQVEIRDANGVVIARVDFLLRAQQTILEFDGMAKYDSATSLAAEKLREDRLRMMGFEVVRVVWADLDRPETLARLLQAAAARAHRRPVAQHRAATATLADAPTTSAS